MSFTVPQDWLNICPLLTEHSALSVVEGDTGNWTPAGCRAVNGAACMSRTPWVSPDCGMLYCTDPPRGENRQQHGRFLLVLFSWGKTAPNLRQKLCEQNTFTFLWRGKSCTAPVQKWQHLWALPCLFPHLICGQGDNPASEPTRLAFLQFSWTPSVLWQLPYFSLEANTAEIPGRPAAIPWLPHLGLKQPHLLKIHSLLAWE